MPCPYANALGVPGQGVHASRIFGLALNDILATIALALITCFLFRISFGVSLLGWFVLGEVLHYYYGTKTAFLKMIGLEPNCNV
jgi:hypothetical protein